MLWGGGRGELVGDNEGVRVGGDVVVMPSWACVVNVYVSAMQLYASFIGIIHRHGQEGVPDCHRLDTLEAGGSGAACESFGS